MPTLGFGPAIGLAFLSRSGSYLCLFFGSARWLSVSFGFAPGVGSVRSRRFLGDLVRLGSSLWGVSLAASFLVNAFALPTLYHAVCGFKVL